jgi:hypothetical protein
LGGIGLELGSLGNRRLELRRSGDLSSWEVVADLWLQGTTNLVDEPVTGGAGAFYRAVAY